jgi:hypothetical protein
MTRRLSLRGLASVSLSRTPPAPDGSSPKCRAASRPLARWLRSPPRIRSPGPTPAKNGAKSHHFTARLTIDVTPDLRGRIKVAAFRRGITVAEMLRDLLSREFPPNPRGTT